MRNKWVGVIFVLLLVVVGFSIVMWLWEESPPLLEGGATESETSEEEVVIKSELDEPIQVAGEGVSASPEKVQIVPQERSEPAARQIEFSGKVVHAETGEPIPEYVISLLHKSEFSKDYKLRKYIRERVQDDGGVFLISLDKVGIFDIRVSAQNYVPFHLEGLMIPEEHGLKDYVIRLDLRLSITGKVVDDATDIPIPDAEVRCSSTHYSSRDEKGNIKRSVSDLESKTKTDESGKFSFTDLFPGVYVLTVFHTGHATSDLDAAAGEKGIEIRMKRGYRVYGMTLDDRSQPAAGVEIRFKGDSGFKGGPYLSGRDGKYQTDPLSPCSIRVSARAPGGKAAKVRDFTEEAYRIEVKDRDVEVNFGPTPDQVIWKGTFYRWDGKPVNRGRVRIWNDRIDDIARERMVEEGASIHRQVLCDEEGRFEIRKLIPGTFKVDMGSGHEHMFLHHGELEVITFDGPGIYELDLRYSQTEISGVVIDGATNKPVKASYGYVGAHCNGRFYSKYLDKNSRFFFKGIPPGTYSMTASCHKHASANYGLVEVAKDQIIDDIRIVLPVNGRLSVKVTGIKDVENTIINLNVNRVDGTTAWSVGPGQFTKQGDWVIEFPHEVGSWVLMLEDTTLGKIENPYEIHQGKTTEIIVKASEFTKDR